MVGPGPLIGGFDTYNCSSAASLQKCTKKLLSGRSVFCCKICRGIRSDISPVVRTDQEMGQLAQRDSSSIPENPPTNCHNQVPVIRGGWMEAMFNSRFLSG